MAQTKVTAALLREFSQTLQTESDRFQQIKKSMDERLESFLWDDPIAIRFKGQYREELEPIEKTLLPAMEKYKQHLDKEAGVVDEYAESDSSNINWGTFAAAGVGGAAMGVGGAAAMGAFSGDSPSIEALNGGIAGDVDATDEDNDMITSFRSSNSNPSNTSSSSSYEGIEYGEYIEKGKQHDSVFNDCDLNPKTWNEKTEEQKLTELRKFEVNMANRQHRLKSDEVISEVMGDGDYGGYINDKLYLNKYFVDKEALNTELSSRKADWDLKKNHPLVYSQNDINKAEKKYNDLKSMDFSPKNAVQTIAHEGYHQCQDQVTIQGFKSPKCGTEAERNAWTLNKNNYIQVKDERPECKFQYDQQGNKMKDQRGNFIINRNDRIGSTNNYLCTYNDYRYGNAIEIRPWELDNVIGNYYDKYYKELPKRLKVRPQRIMK